MNRMRNWTLALSALALSACGTDSAQITDPPLSRGKTTQEFLESLLQFDGNERTSCIEDLVAQLSDQIAQSAPETTAEVLDENLELEINQHCSIKRK